MAQIVIYHNSRHDNRRFAATATKDMLKREKLNRKGPRTVNATIAAAVAANSAPNEANIIREVTSRSLLTLLEVPPRRRRCRHRYSSHYYADRK